MYKSAATFLFLYFHSIGAFSQSNWNLITEDEGIKVFSKTVPDSKIKALKVECILKASSEQLAVLLLDVNAAAEWVFHTKSCVLVRKISASELYYYTEVSLPWPLENRDFVAHIKVSKDPLTSVVTVNAPAVPGFVPAKKGIVRINHSKGLWILTPVDKERIKVEYTLQVDPGGALPAWLVNTFAAQGPLESFKSMRKQLQLPKYKNASLQIGIN